MLEILLNGQWQMRPADSEAWLPASVPGSVYSDLLASDSMPDPYYRDNEMKTLPLSDKDYIYQKRFTLTKEDLSCDALLLHCKGIDTIADIFVNDSLVGHTENMHRTWDFELHPYVHDGENTIQIHFYSPTKWIKEAYQKCEIYGSSDAMTGFPHLRKTHCMFGWDWGLRLPDAGIWRDISILEVDTARLLSVWIHQKHEADTVTLSFQPEIEAATPCVLSAKEDGSCISAGAYAPSAKPTFSHAQSSVSRLELRITVTAPDGSVFTSDGQDIVIEHPQLWWPNGFGGQPLYQIHADLTTGGRVIDSWECRIGLRTLTMHCEKDQWGESFCAQVNGVDIFTMGGDYIPEDALRCRITPERTRRLLHDCKLANHNSIRVWGGGYYPDDWFYDACDEYGLIVWQDCMFACACYELTDDFEANIRQEILDNVRRLRHHASLGLWSGNNELEWLTMRGDYKITPKQKADYLRIFEYIIPKTLRTVDDTTFYWPSSPSSGGGYDEPNAHDRGDVHYWSVWHEDEPFPAYRKYYFRYASEFGFQSFPCLKTVETFTEPKDRNIFSYVMEKHQRNKSANGKIMNYLSATFRYPKDFDHLLYASQLLQAEAVRYGVEHWRRFRGRCMGAIYWQINDNWPVASWASIDYYGRWKALHYASRRFFAPILLSCCEESTLTQETNVNAEGINIRKSAQLNVSNETMCDKDLTVRWALRDANAAIKQQGELPVHVPALTAVWLGNLTFEDAALHSDYFSYELYEGDTWISGGTALFCAPKHFDFVDPHLTVCRSGNDLIVKADAYARSVEIECDDGDLLLEDNYFDLNAEERKIRILRGEGTRLRIRSIYDIG